MFNDMSISCRSESSTRGTIREETTGSYQDKVKELKEKAASTRIVPSGSDGRVWTDYLDKDGKVIGRTYEFPKGTVGKNEQGWVRIGDKDYYSGDLKNISILEQPKPSDNYGCSKNVIFNGLQQSKTDQKPADFSELGDTLNKLFLEA